MNLLQKFKGTYSDIFLFLVFFLYSFKVSPFNPAAILGYLTIFVGVVLWVSARYELGDAFSVFPSAKKLVQTGVYKKTRHPIYMAGIISVFGLCLVYQEIWFYVALFALIIIQMIRARAEEKILTKKFGQTYLFYKKSTWF